MLSFLSIFLSIYVANAASSNALDELTPSQKLALSQIITGTTDDSSCDLSSLISNPAALLAAGAVGAEGSDIDTDTIMQDLTLASQYVTAAAYTDCDDLDLESDECLTDCMHYNHPITLFANTSSPSFLPQLLEVLMWYSVSGSPIGWYDVGNPDQCDYFDGTYCFTPMVNPYDIDQGDYPTVSIPHGCCAPGSCVGDDAVKVVLNNGWCVGAWNKTYNNELLGIIHCTLYLHFTLISNLITSYFCMY